MKKAVSDRIEAVVIVEEVKDTVTWVFVIEDYNGKEVKASFYESFYILQD